MVLPIFSFKGLLKFFLVHGEGLNDDCSSLCGLRRKLPVATTHELLVVCVCFHMEPSHRIALVPVVDASNSNLPGDDAVNFFVLVNFVEEFGVLRLHDWLL